MGAGQLNSEAIGASAMRKAQWRIVPLILLAYLCAYMDRVNVSFAAVQMNVDLGFSATVYGLGAGLFFLGYSLFEIPSNLLAARYGARRWLARIMISWGLLSSATMVIHAPLHFYAMRFLLGVAEAGFYPCLIYYFATWFPASHRARAISRFYVAAPLASVVMGAISGALLDLDGLSGLQGWQWLFLIQGLPSVVMGLAVLRFLPDSPATVPWLAPDEAAWIDRTLAREGESIGAPARHDLFAILGNARVLLLCATSFFASGVMTTFTLSAPLVLIALTGLDATHAGYLISVGGVIGAVAMLAAGAYADRRGDRYLNAFWLLLALAVALLLVASGSSPWFVMAAYLGIAATCFTVNLLLPAGWADALHIRELAVGAAAVNSVANLGGFVMPFAWGAARDATGGFTLGLVALAAFALVAAALALRVRASLRHRKSVATTA